MTVYLFWSFAFCKLSFLSSCLPSAKTRGYYRQLWQWADLKEHIYIHIHIHIYIICFVKWGSHFFVTLLELLYILIYDYNWLWYSLLWYVSPEFLSQHFGKDGGEKKVPWAKEADLDERSSSMLRRREKLEQSEQWRLEFWKTMWYNGVKEKWWVVNGPKSRKIKRPYGLPNSGVQLWGTCEDENCLTQFTYFSSDCHKECKTQQPRLFLCLFYVCIVYKWQIMIEFK